MNSRVYVWKFQSWIQMAQNEMFLVNIVFAYDGKTSHMSQYYSYSDMNSAPCTILKT